MPWVETEAARFSGIWYRRHNPEVKMEAHTVTEFQVMAFYGKQPFRNKPAMNDQPIEEA
jgi:hypothetical protein